MRFDDAKPTEAQGREWSRIVSVYVRRLMTRRHPEFTISVLAKAMGLEDRQTATIASEGRNPSHDPADDLAVEVLSAMRDGTIAGVLGIKHSPESEMIFKLVAQTDPKAIHHNRDEFRRLQDIFTLELLAWRPKT